MNYVIDIFSMYFSHEYIWLLYGVVLSLLLYIITAEVTVLQGALMYNKTNLIIK
jgi:hypothetical protein